MYLDTAPKICNGTVCDPYYTYNYLLIICFYPLSCILLVYILTMLIPTTKEIPGTACASWMKLEILFLTVLLHWLTGLSPNGEVFILLYIQHQLQAVPHAPLPCPLWWGFVSIEGVALPIACVYLQMRNIHSTSTSRYSSLRFHVSCDKFQLYFLNGIK